MTTTPQNVRSTTLSIDGMSCGHCVQDVTKALSVVPGVMVKSVAVGSATIDTVDGETVGKSVAALAEAGYPAKAVGDAAGTLTASTPRSASGCCGGTSVGSAHGRSATPGSTPGAKGPGGCCG